MRWCTFNKDRINPHLQNKLQLFDIIGQINSSRLSLQFKGNIWDPLIDVIANHAGSGYLF